MAIFVHGGAIYNTGNGNIILNHSTLSGNFAVFSGSGIFQTAGSSVELHNTILNDGIDNILGGTVDAGSSYNIDNDGSAGLPGGQGNQVADPLLGVLANNGGYTKTHTLLQGSSAIDTANPVASLVQDQRGLARDAAPDIGALEQSYYLDNFTTNESYAGDDGTLIWANDWQEIGESDGAGAGDVYVWKEPGAPPQNNLLSFGWDNRFGVWREADLSGAASAVLSFDWKAQFDLLDTVTLSASTDGGTSWTTIDIFDGSIVGTTELASYDISNFIDKDTRIKFESTSGFGNNETFSVDNVRIDLYGIASNVAPIATNLSSTSLYAEGASTVTLDNIVVSDTDVAEIITATLTLADNTTGELSANDGATYTAGTGINAGTGIWSITNTVEKVNLALANLEFKPAAGNITDTTIDVKIDDGNEDYSNALTGTITLDVSAIQAVITVTTASDDPLTAATDGLISLREAIATAEATPGLVLIHFDIAGTGPHTITLDAGLGDLEQITDQIIIDGTSQNGYGGSPMIELNGELVTGDGLRFVGGSSGSVVKGLSIINFNDNGIFAKDSNDHTFQSNFIGIRADGTDAGNDVGIKLETDGHLIGGSNPGDGNYISGNDDIGLRIQGSSSNNTVYGNFIGINQRGDAVANDGEGIRVAANSDDNNIGGTTAGQANIIAYNGSDGIEVSGSDNIQIRHNIIYDNLGLQINLNGGNDDGIDDLPTLTSAEYDAATGKLIVKVEYVGDVDNANLTLNLDFFSTPDSDAEGQVYLGSGMIVLDANGAGMMTLESNFNVKVGEYITATATNADGSDGTSAFSAPIQVAVANAPVVYNTAPVLDPTTVPVLTLNSVNEDDPAPTDGDVVGTLVSDLVSLGGNVTDPDAAALVGVAVIEADTEHGSWYYSTNNGVNWYVMSDGSGINIDEEEARLLLADAGTRIYFAPSPSYSGSINEAISIRAWDATSGVNGGLGDTSLNGGTSAFSTLYDNVSIIVISNNNAPTVEATIPDQTLAEDFASYTIDLNAAFTDVETADSALVYSVAGNTNINVSIASGIATITSTGNWNGNETLTFRATDTGSLFVEQTVLFTVTPVNDTPTEEATIPDQTLAEDFASYTIDLNAAFADTETADNALVYSVAGNTNINVSIASGIATITPTANWNGSETLTFRATDAGSLFVEQDVLFTVTPVNDTPTEEATIPDQTLAEDFASYTIDLNAAFADVETADAALVYSVTGNTNINVSIASGIATITPTANWNGSETLTFRATDAGSLFVEQAVLFTVTPVNDTPTEEAAIPDQTLAEDFASYTIDLNAAFADVGNRRCLFSV